MCHRKDHFTTRINSSVAGCSFAQELASCKSTDAQRWMNYTTYVAHTEVESKRAQHALELHKKLVGIL